ncbi:hypothetical protein HK405_005075, partial [Cladochytrium tenue]
MTSLSGSGSNNAAEERLNNRLDAELASLEGQLAHIVRAASIHSTESVLGLTLEIKRAILLNDFQALNMHVGGRWAALREKEGQAHVLLSEVAWELADIVADLEAAYEPGLEPLGG